MSTAAELLARIAQKNQPAKAAAPQRIKRVDVSDIAPKKAQNTKQEFPILPDPTGEVKQLADAFLEASKAEAAAKGNKEMFRGQLIELAQPFHFKTVCGLADPPNSVSAFGNDGEVLVTFKDAYKKLEAPDILERVLGPDVAGQYFRQRLEFSIDCNEVPEKLIPQVVQLLKAMTSELGITKALKVKDTIVPTAEWHAARYRLTPAVNIQLEQAFGEKGFCTVAVSPARGRDK